MLYLRFAVIAALILLAIYLLRVYLPRILRDPRLRSLFSVLTGPMLRIVLFRYGLRFLMQALRALRFFR